MNSENQLYAVYSHTAKPGDNMREGVRAGFNQAQELRWLEQDHGGLEVDHDRCAGIEVDQRRIPQWMEQDPRAAPDVLVHSNEAGFIQNSSGGIETKTSGPRQRKVYWFSRKCIWILVALSVLAIVGGGVGGGVGAALGHHTGAKGGGIPSNHTRSSPILKNSRIAATQYRDSDGNKVYRVYFQSTEGPILEASWALKNPEWIISRITQEDTDIKLGTPIAAAVGPPYDNDTLSVTKRLSLTQSSGGPSYPKRVYFVGQTGSIYERESPHKKQDSVWGNGQLSGKYTASNDSSIVSFWYRNSRPKAQILAVLFQDLGKNSLSIASYRSNKTVTTHWQSTEQSLQTQDGSALAMAPVGDRRDLRLYVAGTSGKMQVYRYNLTSSGLSDPISTRFDIPPGAPLSVSTQDNRDYFTDITLPDCAKHDQPLTHLIIFPTLDTKSLNLVSWNCSSGFLNQTTRLGPLLQENRTYLGLANTMTALDPEDQRVYVVFDAGDGPEIEEWQVPPGAQNAEWKVLGAIPVVLT
ncbi:hypothetical protein ANO14919_104780 [Xylariales sp. No.14919]|nr:hypothetical protein ANO14919_104780 [Xylariales sp. No.14919]